MGWTNIAISKTLSRFIIGANQPSPKYLGYDITKKLLKTFSPKFISFGVIFNALGAMISFNSKALELYISCGRMVEICGSSFFVFRWIRFTNDFSDYKQHNPAFGRR